MWKKTVRHKGFYLIIISIPVNHITQLPQNNDYNLRLHFYYLSSLTLSLPSCTATVFSLVYILLERGWYQSEDMPG